MNRISDPAEPATLAATTTLRPAILTFLGVTAIACGLFWLSKVWPLLQRNLHAIIAVVFFYAPVLAERIQGRRFDFEAAGLTIAPVGKNLIVLGIALGVTFPLFILGFFAFYDQACAGALPDWALRLRHLCPALPWRGWTAGHLHVAPDTGLLAFNQIIVVALPEELFFRGYLMSQLERRWPSKSHFWGAPIGHAITGSALLFALGHFLVDFNPQRLTVFFPGLVFAWMRSRTGSLAAGALFHALCNVLSDVLHASFFG